MTKEIHLFILHKYTACILQRFPLKQCEFMNQPCPESITQKKILIRGAGDIASGIALFLLRQGFRHIVLLEQAKPMAVRRTVSFAEAVFEGQCYVEEVEGVLLHNARDVLGMWAKNAHSAEFLHTPSLPVLVDENALCLNTLTPDVVVEATLSKKNITQVSKKDAPLVIGVGPGFLAGENNPRANVHVVVESNRGESLGRYLEEGTAEPNTGEPAPVMGYTHERVLRAPAKGFFTPRVGLGAHIKAGEIVGIMEDKDIKTPVIASISGRLRGLLHSGIFVDIYTKIGDIEPRADFDMYKVSDKALAIGRGVFNAMCKRIV